jgi:hypothetical protein
MRPPRTTVFHWWKFYGLGLQWWRDVRGTNFSATVFIVAINWSVPVFKKFR